MVDNILKMPMGLEDAVIIGGWREGDGMVVKCNSIRYSDSFTVFDKDIVVQVMVQFGTKVTCFGGMVLPTSAF